MSKITEYDAITGNAIERNLTDLEVAQVAADQAEAEAQAEVAAVRTAAREALLNRLGITVEEAQLLLGGM